jgi:hypothetical protein
VFTGQGMGKGKEEREMIERGGDGMGGAGKGGVGRGGEGQSQCRVRRERDGQCGIEVGKGEAAPGRGQAESAWAGTGGVGGDRQSRPRRGGVRVATGGSDRAGKRKRGKLGLGFGRSGGKGRPEKKDPYVPRAAYFAEKLKRVLLCSTGSLSNRCT